MRRILTLLFVLIAAGAAVWLATRERGAEAARSSGTVAPPQPDEPGRRASADLPATAETPTGAPAREAVAAAPTPDAAPGPLATIRGRCVDAGGRPIAGVRAVVSARRGPDARMVEWRKQHAEPTWDDVDATADMDGRFELRFWPPPPFRISLSLQQSGYATLHTSWPELAPGSVTELGDIVLPIGVELRVRLVDENGQPVPYRSMGFKSDAPDPSEPGVLRPHRGFGGPTGADGSFPGFGLLEPGIYRVTFVSGANRFHPERFELKPGGEVVDIVVFEVAPEDSISGIVVDEQGDRMRAVWVVAWDRRQGASSSAYSNARGEFRLLRPKEDRSESVELRLTEALELSTPPLRVRWGQHDVRLQMQAGIDVEVTVLAAADREPVEEFQLWILPHPGEDRITHSSGDSRVRSAGHHEQGVTRVAGIRRGRHYVVVEPTGGELTGSGFVPITVADPGPTRVTVTLGANVTRELRVQRSDATPVAGTKVQLLDPADLTVDAATRAQTIEQMTNSSTSSPRVLLLQELETDADGEATLRGPAKPQLALRLLGPGHTPLVVPDVALDAPEPLVVTVPTGAKLVGRLLPDGIVAQLREVAGLPASGPLSDADRRFQPTVSLTSPGPPYLQHPPSGGQPGYVQPDGRFELSGIPPGPWRVILTVWDAKEGLGRTGSGGPVAQLELHDGVTTTLDIDASHLQTGELRGLVERDGAPLAGAEVLVRIEYIGGRGGGRTSPLRLDADGRFSLRGRQGRYSILLVDQQADPPLDVHSDVIDLLPGRTTEHRFVLRAATLRLRLLDPDGKPIAEIPLELRDAAGELQHQPPPTSADGRTALVLEPATFSVHVLTRRMQDPQARNAAFENATSPDPLAPHRLRIGEITLHPGATVERELRLPAEWGQ